MTRILLCRFENGVLKRDMLDISTVEFIAISHVWADARWHPSLPGIDWEVLASTYKANFLHTTLPDLTKDDWFWMDILCVDQRNEAARLAIVKQIPEIYRNSQKTIIIREPGGIQPCCAEAVSTFDSWNKEGATRFASHIRTSHFEGLHETWLLRLWPLQEMILSGNLLFTACQDASYKPPEVDVYDNQLSFRRIADGLYCAAQAWVTYGLDDQGDEWEYNMFIKAVFSNGFVARRPVDEARHRPRPLINDFAIHCNSLRTTSKPRDFILAILPQYGWYEPPANVRHMTFGQLWADVCDQSRRAGFGFMPSITRGMTEPSDTSEERRAPSPEIPEPLYLGDFVKLFGCSMSQPEANPWGTLIAPVELEAIDYTDTQEVLATIERSMQFAASEWQLAHRGDLAVHGMFPLQDTMLDTELKVIMRREQNSQAMDKSTMERLQDRKHKLRMEIEARSHDPAYYQTEALKCLNAMWAGLFEQDNMARADWMDLRKELIASPPFGIIQCMVRLATLITCNLGVHMYAWSAQMTPLSARLAGFQMLLLVRNDCALSSETGGYLCVQRGSEGVSGRDIVLVRLANAQIVGKFPEFNQKTVDVETNVDRLRLLYPEQIVHVADPDPPGQDGIER